MFLIDTSVWVSLFRDRSGRKRESLLRILDDGEYFLTRFNQLEMLQGCRDDREWDLLSSYLDTQDYVALTEDSWSKAARIYFDLRRQGRTVRSPIDCCIAQLALDSGMLLLHEDRDFEVIAQVRPLRHLRLEWSF